MLDERHVGSKTFLLTCLLRGMTLFNIYIAKSCLFLLTCLLRGMTYAHFFASVSEIVSTHMPLARHDNNAIASAGQVGGFYSHASCEA